MSKTHGWRVQRLNGDRVIAAADDLAQRPWS